MGLRSMVDIDLLVRAEEVERCKTLLLTAGWNLYDEAQISDFVAEMADSQHPYTFLLGSTKIELHNKLHTGHADYQINMDDYWKRSRTISFLGGDASIFCPTDFLQHLCIHLHKHLVNENAVSIKHFIDIVEFKAVFEEEINWLDLFETSKKYNCQVEVREVLQLCETYFEVNFPNGFLAQFEGESEFDCAFLFIHYLRGDTAAIENYVQTRHHKYKENFQKIKGKWNKSKFLLELFLPSKKFMIHRYGIKNKRLVYLYYFLRIGIGIKRGIRLK